MMCNILKCSTSDEEYDGIPCNRAFIMLLWLCIYHNFYCKKVSPLSGYVK